MKNLAEIKILTERNMKLSLFLLGILVFISLLFFSIYMVTTSPRYCVQCHEMKPEYYTWKSSSHNNFKCTECHLESGIKNLFKYEKWAINELYQHFTGGYSSPIIMPTAIRNAVCNRCHDMNERSVTPSGDLIIPHDIHEKNEIICSKCHGGIAHGSIANRNITFSSDYQRWDEYLGRSIMSNVKLTKPNMEACMSCHSVRNGPLKCNACHRTGMLPLSHKNEEFKNGKHGKTPDNKLPYCHSCHKLMTENEIQGLEEKAKYEIYLEGDKKTKPVLSIRAYAKENVFCKNCHGKRPPSHKESEFFLNHGSDGEKDINRCITCHEYNKVSEAPVTNVACNSCHPSIHENNWQIRHVYYELPNPNNPKLEKECLNCHNKNKCIGCHTTFK